MTVAVGACDRVLVTGDMLHLECGFFCLYIYFGFLGIGATICERVHVTGDMLHL